MDTASKSSDEQIMQFYAAARAEMVQRVSLRDQTLFAYVAAAGAYFGFIVSGQTTKPLSSETFLAEIFIIVVLPVLSLVFTYVILQHHIMIGKMGDYTRSLFPEKLNHWDQYYVTWDDRRYLSARTISQALLLILPVAYTLSFLLRAVPFIRSDFTLLVAALLVFVFILFVFGTIIRLHIWAYSVRRQTDQVKHQTSALHNASAFEPLQQSPKVDFGLSRPFGRTLFTIAVFRALLGVFVLATFDPASPKRMVACLVAVVVAQFSDHIDGMIARNKSSPSIAGYLQDSVADKLLHVGCLIPLASRFEFVAILLWCLIAREFVILAVRILDNHIEATFKRFRPQSIAHVVLLRVGIFGFLLASFGLSQTIQKVVLAVSYFSLSAGVIFGLVNLMLVVKAVMSR